MSNSEVNKFNYNNPKVLKVREELGDFIYVENVENSSQVEMRPMIEIKSNQARYEGEWVIGKDIR